VKNETGLRAGTQPGDRREFGECTSEQRRIIDQGIAEGMEDFRKGRSHGPFTADEAVNFLKSQMRRPHTKSVKRAR
jgi:hypothetical protein